MRWLEELGQDLRYGFRMLMKNYGFTLTAVLCLGLGIGVNTSIFSTAHALLLRSFPVPQADQLVVLIQGKLNLLITYRNFVRIRDNNGVLSDLAAFEYVRFSFGNRDQSEFISGELVSGNYFDVLKLKPALGRTFLPEEDRIPGAHPVAVLSHKFWQSRLSGDPNVIGRTITINGHRFTVVGVAPHGFKGMVTPYPTSLWIPMMMSARVKHDFKRADDLRGFGWFRLSGVLNQVYLFRRLKRPYSYLALALMTRMKTIVRNTFVRSVFRYHGNEDKALGVGGDTGGSMTKN